VIACAARQRSPFSGAGSFAAIAPVRAVTGIFQGILLFFLLACDILILFRVKFLRPLAARLGAAE